METENSEKAVKGVEVADENISSEASQLIKIVLAMPVQEQRELLAKLSMRKPKLKRKNHRKSYFTSVQFSASSLVYSGYMTNMSFTGAFIEAPKTDLKRLKNNETVILTFQHPETKVNVKLDARIVRIDENGVGVRFVDPISVKGDFWAG